MGFRWWGLDSGSMPQKKALESNPGGRSTFHPLRGPLQYLCLWAVDWDKDWFPGGLAGAWQCAGCRWISLSSHKGDSTDGFNYVSPLSCTHTTYLITQNVLQRWPWRKRRSQWRWVSKGRGVWRKGPWRMEGVPSRGKGTRRQKGPEDGRWPSLGGRKGPW